VRPRTTWNSTENLSSPSALVSQLAVYTRSLQTLAIAQQISSMRAAAGSHSAGDVRLDITVVSCSISLSTFHRNDSE